MKKKMYCKKKKSNKKRESSEPRDQRPGPRLEQALAPHDADDPVARVVALAAAAAAVVVAVVVVVLAAAAVAAAAVTSSPASSVVVPAPAPFLFQDRKRLLQVDKGALQQVVAHDELDAAVGLDFFFFLEF